jgi:hypothetical protein
VHPGVSAHRVVSTLRQHSLRSLAHNMYRVTRRTTPFWAGKRAVWMWQGSTHGLYGIDLINTPSSNESSMATLRMPLPGTPPFTHSPECTPGWGVTSLRSNRARGATVSSPCGQDEKKQARFGPLEQRGGVSLASTTSAPLTTHCGSHHALRHDGRCVGSRSRVGGRAPPPTTHSD